MATLPPIRRLLLEDYPSQKAWIAPLLLVLNNFNESIVNALNKSLNLADNSTSDTKYITVVKPPTPSNPINISWTKSAVPVSVVVGNVYGLVNNKNVAIVLTTAVGVQWQMASSTSLQITNIVGLPATPSNTSQYVITLTCSAG